MTGLGPEPCFTRDELGKQAPLGNKDEIISYCTLEVDMAKSSRGCATCAGGGSKGEGIYSPVKLVRDICLGRGPPSVLLNNK